MRHTTVLFTNKVAQDLFAYATDSTTPAALDTILPVAAGAQVCLRHSASRQGFDDAVKLELILPPRGDIAAIAYITPGFWTSDGSTGSATPAPPC